MVPLKSCSTIPLILGKNEFLYLIMQIMVIIIVILHIVGLILIFYTETALIVYITYGGINLAVSIFVFGPCLKV